MPCLKSLRSPDPNTHSSTHGAGRPPLYWPPHQTWKAYWPLFSRVRWILWRWESPKDMLSEQVSDPSQAHIRVEGHHEMKRNTPTSTQCLRDSFMSFHLKRTRFFSGVMGVFNKRWVEIKEKSDLNTTCLYLFPIETTMKGAPHWSWQSPRDSG